MTSLLAIAEVLRYSLNLPIEPGLRFTLLLGCGVLDEGSRLGWLQLTINPVFCGFPQRLQMIIKFEYFAIDLKTNLIH